MTLPLEGYRMLDTSRLIPGPTATWMLADLGMEVIKIEEVETRPGRARDALSPATDTPAELGPQDYVVITLKAHSVPGVVDARIQQARTAPVFAVDIDRTRAQYVGLTTNTTSKNDDFNINYSGN